MNQPYKILIFGASYGSLLATKLGLAGHSSYLICLPAEAELINAAGARVRCAPWKISDWKNFSSGASDPMTHKC